MTGASITVTKTIPQLGKTLIYFTVTLDTDEKADFSAYTSVEYISAVDADTLVPEAATAYTAGGDITFTTDSNAIKGVAIVTL